VDGLDLDEIHNAQFDAEGGELLDSLPVGAAGVGIADVRAEEGPASASAPPAAP